MKNSKNKSILIFTLIGLIILVSTLFLIRKSEKWTEKNTVPVYFVKTLNDGNFKLTSVRRKVSPNKSRFEIAIKYLLKGPSKKERKRGFYTEIPHSTKLLGIKEAQDKINLNLSEDFESGGGSTSMTMRLKQLINTAVDSANDKPVYLLLNGKKVSVIGGEGVYVPQPLSRDLTSVIE